MKKLILAAVISCALPSFSFAAQPSCEDMIQNDSRVTFSTNIVVTPQSFDVTANLGNKPIVIGQIFSSKPDQHRAVVMKISPSVAMDTAQGYSIDLNKLGSGLLMDLFSPHYGASWTFIEKKGDNLVFTIIAAPYDERDGCLTLGTVTRGLEDVSPDFLALFH